MAPEMQVKRRISLLPGKFGSRWAVYETGSSKHYLFRLVDPAGVECGIEHPVLKSEVQQPYRSLLSRALRGGR